MKIKYIIQCKGDWYKVWDRYIAFINHRGILPRINHN